MPSVGVPRAGGLGLHRQPMGTLPLGQATTLLLGQATIVITWPKWPGRATLSSVAWVHRIQVAKCNAKGMERVPVCRLGMKQNTIVHNCQCRIVCPLPEQALSRTKPCQCEMAACSGWGPIPSTGQNTVRQAHSRPRPPITI